MTIELEISGYDSGDIDEVCSWQAPNNNVYFQLTIEIEEKNVEGGNFFQLVVATREGIESHHHGEIKADFDSLKKNGGYDLAKNGLLVLDEYSWENLENKLNEIVKSCERNTWQDSIYELRKHFFWEYENIQYH